MKLRWRNTDRQSWYWVKSLEEDFPPWDHGEQPLDCDSTTLRLTSDETFSLLLSHSFDRAPPGDLRHTRVDMLKLEPAAVLALQNWGRNGTKPLCRDHSFPQQI